MRDRIRTTLTGAALAALMLSAAAARAQRTQSVGDKPTAATGSGQIMTATPPPAPASVPTKYEGGVVGYGKADGTLNFDDANRRLLFRNKAGQEVFSVPYDVIVAAYADTKSRRSTAGTVIANTAPYGLGLPALLLKNKTRYLTLHYSDPDTRAEGITSFKLNSKELLASVLYTLGQKAGLTQRGDAFIRRRNDGDDDGPGATIIRPVPVPTRTPGAQPTPMPRP